jgi:AraC family transcriptional regulator, regulatory protein of adaptative response / methylated-DNA-[protein]-cysteine methyltransferase
MSAQIAMVKQVETPLGPMYIGATDQGVCFAEFINEEHAETRIGMLCRETGLTIGYGEHVFLGMLEQELCEYFAKKRKGFTVPLHITGSGFQQSVWNALLQIPYGKTWTYKQQALHLDNLLAIRAIAAANGQNRHAIVIPCHRVIGSDGSLTGYAGGLAKKEWLLKHEGALNPQLFDLF